MIDTAVESKTEYDLANRLDTMTAELNRLKAKLRLVPVLEDLPALEQSVLALLHDGNFVVACRFGMGLWHAGGMVYDDFEVTHWMRLPKKTEASQ